MRYHTAALLVALAVVSACTSPEEQRAADQQRCYGYGYVPGTDNFAHCMMTTAMQRDAQQAADHRAYELNESLKAQQKSALESQAQRTDLPLCHLSDAGVTQTINGWAGPGCAGMSH